MDAIPRLPRSPLLLIPPLIWSKKDKGNVQGDILSEDVGSMQSSIMPRSVQQSQADETSCATCFWHTSQIGTSTTRGKEHQLSYQRGVYQLYTLSDLVHRSVDLPASPGHGY